VQNGQNSETPTPPNDYIPSYVNPLTGLEITKEQSSLRPIGFVLDGLSPLYSISLCDVVVELPIENGATRILAITSDMTNAWKIGSLAHTRGYISNIGKFFDAIIASTGNDDSIDYISCDTAKEQLLLSVDNTYCYSEYSYYLYTNVNLINSSLNAYQINQNRNYEKTSPFNFVSFGAEEIKGDASASFISVAYSSNLVCRFDYSDNSGLYTLSRNGNANNDLLNNSPINYKNCLILFADSVTYEGITGAQTVMNTIGSGDGYYFTNGSAIRIQWHSDAEGNMTLSNEEGAPLTINQGKSYIGFVKSSRIDSVSFS
jgi:hypothetical protein